MLNNFPETPEEILEDPHKFGVPTYKEFLANRDKWTGNSLNDELGSIDNSTQLKDLRDKLKKQQYMFRGYLCATLEELDNIAKNEGVDLLQCKVEPQIIPGHGGDFDIVVNIKEPIIQIYKAGVI